MKFISIIALLASSTFAAPALDYYGYCTFYADSACTKQVGGTSYYIGNEGCFQNSGPYFKCSPGVDGNSFALVQSPDNDDSCHCQNDCRIVYNFNVCNQVKLNPAYSTFRIEHDMTSCPANNC